MTEREKYVGCALSFFRARWQRVPRFKKSKRAHAPVCNRARYCELARRYIEKARRCK